MKTVGLVVQPCLQMQRSRFGWGLWLSGCDAENIESEPLLDARLCTQSTRRSHTLCHTLNLNLNVATLWMLDCVHRVHLIYFVIR